MKSSKSEPCGRSLASPRGFWGEQGYGTLGRREPKKKTSLRGKRAYVVHLALPSFPQQVRWADLRDAVSFLPFAAIVLTAGPKSQRASPAHPSHPRTPIGRLRRDASPASAFGSAVRFDARHVIDWLRKQRR